jgi:hypothetical protein
MQKSFFDRQFRLWQNICRRGVLPMKRLLRTSRTPSSLSIALNSRLSTYAVAAAAAGVSLLAFDAHSDAEVVYTPTDQIINRTSSYSLDLNRDGIVDFIIADHRSKSSTRLISRQSLFVKPAAPWAKIKCGYPSCLSTFIYATALPQGSLIGSSQNRHGWLPGFAQMAAEERFNGKPYYFGAFNRVQNRYLGLQFQIGGATHYGWARLTVKFHGGATNDRTWEAHLTGYAYETVANQPIKAGQTAGGASDEDEYKAVVGPPTDLHGKLLGALALGADGIEDWRRK